jgi:hypothetical protein
MMMQGIIAITAVYRLGHRCCSGPRAVAETHVEWNIRGKPREGEFASRPIDKLTIVP